MPEPGSHPFQGAITSGFGKSPADSLSTSSSRVHYYSAVNDKGDADRRLSLWTMIRLQGQMK
jgi:hypothetical protein